MEALIKVPPHQLLMCTGAGARVAVLDSGRNPDFPALKTRNGDVFGCVLRNGALDIKRLSHTENTDRSNHGSIVESLLRNIAPDAHVDHYRILDANCGCDGDLLCSVLEHVVKSGYHVINLSLGTRNERLLPRLVGVLKTAYESDVTIVASSSNIGNSVYPARFPYCISTTAHPARHGLHLVFTPRSVIEFGAWGVDVPIDGPDNELLRVSGSSYAAAQVSGLAARAVQLLGAQASPLDVKMLLRNYAQEMNPNENWLAS
jgi:subtilisin family serine protease